MFCTYGCLYVTRKCPVNHRYEVSLNGHITVSHITDSWHLSGPVVCLLLDVSSEYAQPITGQVTKVTCPVIDRAQPEFTRSKGQKTGPGGLLTIKMSSYQYKIPMLKIRRSCNRLIFNMDTWEKRSLYWDGALVLCMATLLKNSTTLTAVIDHWLGSFPRRDMALIRRETWCML